MERNVTVLIAEDSSDYAMFMRLAWRDAGRPETMHVVENGEEVVSYLKGEGIYNNRDVFALPAMLLLDLKMPGMDGFDVLRWMQENPECRVIPTLVLSSSVQERDVRDAYSLGANAYLAKPGNLNDLKAMLNDAWKFWAWCAKPETLLCRDGT
jgi:CheY-like chemotaxis protein